MKPARKMSKKDLQDHMVTYHRSIYRCIAHLTKDKLVAFHASRHAPDAIPGARPTVPHSHDGD